MPELAYHTLEAPFGASLFFKRSANIFKNHSPQKKSELALHEL